MDFTDLCEKTLIDNKKSKLQDFCPETWAVTSRISYYIFGVVVNFFKSYFCHRYCFWALAEFDQTEFYSSYRPPDLRIYLKKKYGMIR